MNVDDVILDDEFVIPERNEDKLELIFKQQQKLIDKYHHIESRNGFHVGTIPLNLDDRFDQHRAKDLAWRIVEELGEATEEGVSEAHRNEELADALHFLVELLISVGFKSEEFKFNTQTVPKGMTGFKSGYFGFITHLGTAMNCLKNKPWKQSHMSTDKDKFKLIMHKAWSDYMYILSGAGLTEEDVFLLYFKKSFVNEFRQRSNY